MYIYIYNAGAGQEQHHEEGRQDEQRPSGQSPGLAGRHSY